MPVTIGAEEMPQPIESVRSQRCFMGGAWREVPCYEAAEMASGAEVSGPALVQQEHSALVVLPGWRARSMGDGGVRLAAGRDDRADDMATSVSRPQAVELELMSNRFSSIAREMGEMLQRTAISTNIKER